MSADKIDGGGQSMAAREEAVAPADEPLGAPPAVPPWCEEGISVEEAFRRSTPDKIRAWLAPRDERGE